MPDVAGLTRNPFNLNCEVVLKKGKKKIKYFFLDRTKLLYLDKNMRTKHSMKRSLYYDIR